MGGTESHCYTKTKCAFDVALKGFFVKGPDTQWYIGGVFAKPAVNVKGFDCLGDVDSSRIVVEVVGGQYIWDQQVDLQCGSQCRVRLVIQGGMMQESAVWPATPQFAAMGNPATYNTKNECLDCIDNEEEEEEGE